MSPGISRSSMSDVSSFGSLPGDFGVFFFRPSSNVRASPPPQRLLLPHCYLFVRQNARFRVSGFARFFHIMITDYDSIRRSCVFNMTPSSLDVEPPCVALDAPLVGRSGVGKGKAPREAAFATSRSVLPAPGGSLVSGGDMSGAAASTFPLPVGSGAGGCGIDEELGSV